MTTSGRRRLFNISPVLLTALMLVGWPARAQDKNMSQPTTPSAGVAGHADYQATADKLIRAANSNSFAYQRLVELCDTLGPRLSGSTNLEAALDWALARMKADGLENVHADPVMVPHWVRGAESLELLEPTTRNMPMLGLGGSVATPPEGIIAPVLLVRDFDELKRRAAEARGKIVVFNAPFVTYGKTVVYRAQGAIEAGKVGAVASLVRSVTPNSLQTPHTGGMSYADGVPKIPHASITVEDAEALQRWQDRGRSPVVRLKMSAQTLPDAASRNVMGEIRGREKPEEVVLVSGHLDSWDVGQGAQDDGGGAVAAWEALRLMHELGLRPRRTVRVVLWVNEENGLRGAKAYAKQHEPELPKHLLAIEADEGTFPPTGFSFKGREQTRTVIESIGALLKGMGADAITAGDGGADVEQLVAAGVPVMGLTVENPKYFWYHHSAADTLDKVNPKDLSQCAAAMAVMAWAVAERVE